MPAEDPLDPVSGPHAPGSHIRFNEANTIKQDGYSLLDLRIGYERENYGVYLFARNLLDSEYYTNTYQFLGAPAATPGIPRILGAELRASF